MRYISGKPNANSFTRSGRVDASICLELLSKSAAVTIAIVIAVFVGAVPTPAIASVYSNTLFSYAVDLPPGWRTESPTTAASSQFTCPEHETILSLSATTKSGPLGNPEIDHYRQRDESVIRARATNYKAIRVTGPDIDGASVAYYGFAYRDKDGRVQVTRFALFSKDTPSIHTWVKVHAVCPKAHFAAVSRMMDAFLLAFRWLNVSTASSESSPAVTALPATQSTALPAQITISADRPEPPKVSQNGSFWTTCRKVLNPQDAKLFCDSFAGNGTKRTDEELCLARQRMLGGMFQGVN
jgi:hypothetical protein